MFWHFHQWGPVPPFFAIPRVHARYNTAILFLSFFYIPILSMLRDIAAVLGADTRAIKQRKM